jgi:hypothetical protein
LARQFVDTTFFPGIDFKIVKLMLKFYVDVFAKKFGAKIFVFVLKILLANLPKPDLEVLHTYMSNIQMSKNTEMTLDP